MNSQPENLKPQSRVTPLSEWAGIMQHLADEGKIMPDNDLDIWDVTVADGLEDDNWDFPLPAEIEK